jgi:hypothetical protein
VNCQNPLSISCDSTVHISVYKKYTGVLIAGPLRELPARLRPVSRLARQPELPTRSATPYLLSYDIFVRSPPYLRATTRSRAWPVSCLVILCVCVCVCVFLTAIWVSEKTKEENKQERKVQLACNESRRHRPRLQCSHHSECYCLQSYVHTAAWLFAATF